MMKKVEIQDVAQKMAGMEKTKNTSLGWGPKKTNLAPLAYHVRDCLGQTKLIILDGVDTSLHERIHAG